MNDLEYCFEDIEEIEQVLMEGLGPGQSLSAVRVLTETEGQDEETLKALLDALTKKRIALDVSALPKPTGQGPSAQRLRLEEKLVKDGNLLHGLEPGDPLRLYLEEIAGLPVFGDPDAVAMKLGNGDESMEYRLADLMFSRVIEVSKEYVGRGVLLQDLIQEASLGLWHAIQIYKTGDKTESFTSCCDWWLRQYLAEVVTVQAKIAGVGEKLYRAAEDYRSVDERLLTELGRNPTLEEMAEGLHMSVEETAAVAEMLENARLMQRVKAPEEKPLPEEEDQAVEDTAYFRMRQRVSELLSGVSEADAKLLSLRYGLEGGLPMDPQQVAQKMGITPEEVINREAVALSKLRQQN